jgi:uncharacterized protein YndB with AHSA1/START domain
MTDMPYQLDRSIVIEARPDVVFDFLSESEYWARWWGAGSRIDPTPGGEVYIRHANGIEVRGRVLEVAPPRRIVFSYGFAPGGPVAPEGSRVEIELEPHTLGTRLHLRHHFLEAAARDEHVQGWRFQLSLFGNVVADRVHADAATRADAWFAAWAEPDEAARRRELERIATPDVRFRDRYSRLDGTDDVVAHIGAALKFMAGMRLERDGPPRHCQGTALVDWIATAEGQPRGRGTNAFHFDADGRIDAVTGFWSA